jgi:hypothetical protein
MRRALFGLAFVLVGIVAACNAISGLDADFVLVPFDGGPDGGPDATTTDGATNDDSSTADVTTSDAPSDAGPSDAFSCDAGDGANVAFCTDFETDASWDQSELDEGTVGFELEAGLGGSRGMHAHVNDAPGVSRRAALWKTISGVDAKTFTHYDVSYDFMISKKTFPYSALGVFAVTQPAGGGGLRFYGAASFDDKTLDNSLDEPQITADKIGVLDVYGTWHRALVALDREPAGTYAVSVRIDATTVDTRTGFDFGDAQTAELRIGILFTSTLAGTMDLYVDNVLVHRVK